MIESEDVPLGHLLTVVSGQMFCIDGPDGLVALMRFMTQYPVHSYGPQVRGVWPICRHALVRQHPWLLRVPLPTYEQLHGGVYRWAWLDAMERKWGPAYPVLPVEDEDWQAHGHPRAPRAFDQHGHRLEFRFGDPS